MEKREFRYDGRDLAAVAVPIDGGAQVRVVENGKPVGGAVYSVTGEIAADMRGDRYNPVQELLRIAEFDFIAWSDWRKEQQHKSAGTATK